jgi:putative ABC transport system permease protein
MRWLRISLANILSRPLGSTLAILLMAFGVGIVSLLFQLNRQLEKQFTKNIRSVDMVVGAKGSPLQLILSGIYHIDAPTGNIALSEIHQLEKNPMVKEIIPLSLGDNYNGYRIVGTTVAYVEHFGGELSHGKMFEHSLEATIGIQVAERNNLKIGDTFFGTHGLQREGGHAHDDHHYTVTGILKPSGTVLDQLVLTPLESVWAMHAGHDHDHSHDDDTHDHNHAHNHDHDHAHEDIREVTIGLVKFTGPMARLQLPRYINQNTNMQAALPAIEVNRLLGLFGVGISTLQWLALVIMLLSAISVFVALYNSLRERKYEMALLRSLGTSRMRLFSLVVSEGVLLAFMGFVFGWGLSRGAMLAVSSLARESYRYNLRVWEWHLQDMYLLLVSLLIGLVAALIPAIQAYATKIHVVLGGKNE